MSPVTVTLIVVVALLLLVALFLALQHEEVESEQVRDARRKALAHANREHSQAIMDLYNDQP